jgi:hypothetical protein
MRAWRGQRGEISPGCIIGVIVLLIVVVIAIKTIPVITRMGEFQATIEHLAERASSSRYNDKVITRRLVEKADELALPVTPETIKITRRKSSINIKIEYTMEVRYPLYTYQWHKIHDETRPLF